MPLRSPNSSATSHGLIRFIIVVSFLVALVTILFLHQPQLKTNVSESNAQQGTQNTNPQKSWKGFVNDPIDVLTLGIFIVGAAQAYLFLRQLTFIRVSLADTKKAAKAAKRQAKLARDSLIASNRAWIEPIVKRSTSALIVNEVGANYAVKVSFRNTGNVPATDIHIDGWLVGRAMKNSSGIDQISPLVPHRLKCLESRTKFRDKIGDMLFPNEIYPRAQGYSSVEICCSMSSEDVKRAMFIDGDRKCIVLYAGGAINYRFVTDDKTHQTSFLYEITLRGVSCSFNAEQECRPGEDISISVVPEGDCRQAD